MCIWSKLAYYKSISLQSHITNYHYQFYILCIPIMLFTEQQPYKLIMQQIKSY